MKFIFLIYMFIDTLIYDVFKLEKNDEECIALNLGDNALYIIVKAVNNYIINVTLYPDNDHLHELSLLVLPNGSVRIVSGYIDDYQTYYDLLK